MQLINTNSRLSTGPQVVPKTQRG